MTKKNKKHIEYYLTILLQFVMCTSTGSYHDQALIGVFRICLAVTIRQLNPIY